MESMKKASDGIEVLSDQGSGRCFVAVIDSDQYADLAQDLAERLSHRARTILLRCQAVSDENWAELSRVFEATLESLKVRQASFVGFGAGAAIIQNIALETPKVARSLVVVDSTLRPHPSAWQRWDAIERRLPFGLPLRLGSRGFNVRSYAHRLRCPVLVVGTARANSFVRAELSSLGALAPTAWLVQLESESRTGESGELSDLVVTFQDTPAKCPQKNRQEVA
jgi:pimeloyl-ACP methyl ester carboxylesterase